MTVSKAAIRAEREEAAAKDAPMNRRQGANGRQAALASTPKIAPIKARSEKASRPVPDSPRPGVAGALGLPNYPAFRDDPLLKSLHPQLAFQNLLLKLKREWEGYRQEFARK